MENEQNQPQPPQAQPPAGNPANPNPNPAKRGRRRRRRRSAGGSGAQQAQGGQPAANGQQAQGAGQTQQPRKHKQHGSGGHKQHGGSHRHQQRHAQPGNQQGGRGGGAGRRRRRGPGGQPSFVGPMDHSYRQGNGFDDDFQPGYQPNFNGNFHGQGRGRQNHLGLPQDNVEVVPIKVENITTVEGAPRVICFIEDLFFHAKIREVAKKIGVNVEFAKADKETIDRITSEDEEKPPLIIFDLNNLNAKPLLTIPKLKNKLKRQTSIVGFVSHIQGDLKLKAQEAGCDMVVPRSAFSSNLPNLLRRYSGMEEETGYERGPSH